MLNVNGSVKSRWGQCHPWWMGGVAGLVLAGGGLVAGAQRPAVAAALRVAPTSQLAQAAPEPAIEPAAPQANTPPLKDDLFAGTEKFAKGATDVTEVTMDPDSLEMVSGNESKKAHRMLLNVVRTYTYDKPGMYNPADVEEYRRKLETGDWHCSVHVRELKSGESTDVCSKRRPPDMIETAIITMEPKELTFIHNIRKANGEGGMNGFGVVVPGMMMGLPPGAMIAMIGPEMRAEMLANTAEMRARSAEMFSQMGALHNQLPKLDSEEMKKQMEGVRKQMEELRLHPPQIDQEQMNEQMKEFQKQLKAMPPLPPAPPLAPVPPLPPQP